MMDLYMDRGVLHNHDYFCTRGPYLEASAGEVQSQSRSAD